MNIGEFKHRISIMEETQTETENGFKVKEWTERTKTWAKITKQRRETQNENGKTIEIYALVFFVRYQDIKTTERITYQGRLFTIESVEDSTFEKRYLTITVKEVA